jgi:flagellar P-ring protein precursor FlgI
MRSRTMDWIGRCCACVLALCATSAHGAQIQNLVRIKGHEHNTLTGLGLVVGLNGTGDTSKDSYIAARPFAALLENLGNPVGTLSELEQADSYALVMVTMTVPSTGAREGDRLDVQVATLFNAESLEGGQLVVSMLRPALPDSPDLLPLAEATGMLVVDGVNPRVATVRDGGKMRADLRTDPITDAGYMWLVIEDRYAGYPVAATIANAINQEFFADMTDAIAVVEDAKNIRIRVPEADRPRPAEFIAMLMTIPIDPSLLQIEARITVNEDRGIITVTGNVEIGAVGITHNGLTITSVTPAVPPPGGMRGPERWRNLDTTDGSSRTSTKLPDLLAALDQLNVPVRDQIAILYELRKSGALHAEIIAQ